MSDALWIKHDYRVDFILSTAMEIYHDEWMNLKGSPTGAVYVKNKSLDDFVVQLREHAVEMERKAPSKYFRQNGGGDSLLIHRPVDVLNWSSDYCTAPYTTVAQSLPNNEMMKKSFGVVNLLYVNTTNSLQLLKEGKNAREFISTKVLNDVLPHISYGDSVHSMIHELGHTTGEAADKEKRTLNPETILGNEYNSLEELRAELFGMYGVYYCAENGIIKKEEEKGAYYGMLITMLTSLRVPPVQAHQKARNMMYHFFLKKGAIIIEEEEVERVGGKKEKVKKFIFDEGKLHDAVLEFLGTVQNIKSELNKEGMLGYLHYIYIFLLFIIYFS